MAALVATTADEWQNLVSRSLYSLDLAVHPATFQGSMRQLQLPRGVSVADIVTDPISLHRTQLLVRRSPSNDMLLLIELTGMTTVEQAGRRVQLGAGAATLCDPLAEYRVTSDQRSHHLVLLVPRQVVARMPIPVAELQGRRLDPHSPTTRALVAVAHEAATSAHELATDESDALASAMLHLAKAAVAHSVSLSAREPSRVVTKQAALAHIRANATSPDLSPIKVADALRVSPRTLNNVLAEFGGPAEVIREERLTHAREMLLDPGSEQFSIGGVARQSGFNDATTFTRAFRRKFGDRPSDLRADRPSAKRA